jgi:hypothetical protein
MNDEAVQRPASAPNGARGFQEGSRLPEAGSCSSNHPCRSGARNGAYYGGQYKAAKPGIGKTSHLAVRCAILAKMTLGMPADNISLEDLEAAIAHFRASGSSATPSEVLLLPCWRDEDWKQLFRFTSIRRVMAGER